MASILMIDYYGLGVIRAYDSSTGTQEATASLTGTSTRAFEPLPSGDGATMLYRTGSGTLRLRDYAADLTAGSEWTYAINTGHSYLGLDHDSSDVAYFASVSSLGTVRVFSVANATTVWTKTYTVTDASLYSSAGPWVVHDGTILWLVHYGQVIALDPADGTELDRVTWTGKGDAQAMVAASDGTTLYVVALGNSGVDLSTHVGKFTYASGIVKGSEAVVHTPGGSDSREYVVHARVRNGYLYYTATAGLAGGAYAAAVAKIDTSDLNVAWHQTYTGSTGDRDVHQNLDVVDGVIVAGLYGFDEVFPLIDRIDDSDGTLLSGYGTSDASWTTSFIAVVGAEKSPVAPIIGQPDDRYRSSVAADAGSLLASQQPVPFDTSSSITFGLGTNIDQTVLYPLREVTRDQDGAVKDVLFYPRARQGQGERSYDGITMLTLMERNYPPSIFDTTTNLGLGASATASEIITYVLQQWDARYDWFSFATVPDLRTRVDGLPAPSGYGATTGLITDTSIAIRQGESQQSMRQILDGLLSPFPGTIYYQDSAGDLVIRPAYGPDADETPIVTFENSDIASISIGEADAFNITNRATATATQYSQTEGVEVMQPAWFHIASNRMMGDAQLFDPPSGRLNLSGATTDDTSTRQETSPVESFSNENRPLPWFIQANQLLGSGGITPVVTVAYQSKDGSKNGATGATVTTVPLSGEMVDMIRVDQPDFDVTITGRWDATNQRVILGLGTPMRLESGGSSWNLEFTLNDLSDAWAEGASLSNSFGFVSEGDTLPANDGGNAIEDSQTAFGVLEANIDARVYGGLTSDQLHQIAKGYVQQNITPRATRELQLGWKGSTKALFDRRGRLVGLPGDGEGFLVGVANRDDFNAVAGGKTARVEQTVAGAAGVIDTTVTYIYDETGDYLLDEDGAFVEDEA